MVLTYMLYLRVSGQFHIIIGFLHLFGYDLPETHRKYLLSRSLTDFWRRINIYWKDFMVKMVYFPVYFRLRRSGDVRAQVVATVLVFADDLVPACLPVVLAARRVPDDVARHAVLGHSRRPRHDQPADRAAQAGTGDRPAAWRRRLEPLKIAGTFCLIVTLWSLWNSPSVGEWLDLVTWWKVG